MSIAGESRADRTERARALSTVSAAARVLLLAVMVLVTGGLAERMRIEPNAPVSVGAALGVGLLLHLLAALALFAGRRRWAARTFTYPRSLLSVPRMLLVTALVTTAAVVTHGSP